jgi:hypothetical protein
MPVEQDPGRRLCDSVTSHASLMTDGRARVMSYRQLDRFIKHGPFHILDVVSEMQHPRFQVRALAADAQELGSQRRAVGRGALP